MDGWRERRKLRKRNGFGLWTKRFRNLRFAPDIQPDPTEPEPPFPPSVCRPPFHFRTSSVSVPLIISILYHHGQYLSERTGGDL
ncbi:uncharacterized protein LAJ45_05369 [Morchella importuna]|uniref:uncharacterized protein n=1 Tax=Morchella importuna TaxID=1174673 RepID=UPI001E8DC473|nr:uncharacterized protein LAJ45_05369 [Morchella importuna]KAH8150673.1 hypothetical protein LAJ45_05369 [Morchella importuna]